MSKHKILSVGICTTDNLGDIAIMTMIHNMFTDAGYQVEKIDFNFRALVENTFPFLVQKRSSSEADVSVKIVKCDCLDNRFFKTLRNCLKFFFYWPLVLIIFLRKSRGCSKVFIGGGNLLMGVEYGFPLQALTYVLFSKLMRKRVDFLCVGAGPFTAPGVKFLLGYALRLSDRVICRDSESMKLIEKEFGSDSVKLDVIPDPVLLWPKLSETKGYKYDVLINVLPLFSVSIFPDGDKQKANNFRTSIERLITELISRELTVGIFITDAAVDAHIGKQVIEGVLANTGTQLILEVPSNPNELAMLCNQTRIIFSSRMHGAIMALSQYVPALCICWQPKVEGLYSELQMEDFLVKLDDLGRFSVSDTVSKIFDIHTKQQAYIGYIQQKLDKIKSQYIELWGTL
ncbi:MAG: polysaccharide pyruvyl transferase family protein [Gammaproteobacteria bacterium]|nr:polysaccharide pyruvyl transferase family protein [Gammaproteobacteria bacterium]